MGITGDDLGCLSQTQVRRQPFLQASAERYHMEPHPEHLFGAYPYAYPPMPAMVPHHGFEDWSQIRYPPPPMAMEHPLTSLDFYLPNIFGIFYLSPSLI